MLLKKITHVLLAAGILATTTTVVVGSATPAQAGPADNFTLAKTDNREGKALIGENVTYTLTASGTQSSNAYLYNLSFRDVLPVGTSYVSANPAPTAVLTNVPSAGNTTLIWENTNDLPANSTASVSYVVDTNPDFAGGTTGSATAPVGSVITNNASAVASLNAFAIPDWSPATGAFTGDYDGQAAATHNVDVEAFRVTRTGPDELLRGVHGNGFGGRTGTSGGDYTITVTNNSDYATNAITVTDVLDPQFEFLGCDNYYNPADDNSTDVPLRESTADADEEWDGSGPMATGAGSCDTPTSVTSVAAGGGLADTHVQWTIGNLAAGASATIEFRAGIPMRANTMTWSGGSTPVGALAQGRNLDNNSGPQTNELDRTLNTDPELLTDGAPGLQMTATASGTYTPNGSVQTADDTEITESEDVLIAKSMTGSLSHGTTVATTLNVSTSEYRDFSNLVVRDLLPSALCYTGTYSSDITSGGSDWESNDCPGAGTGDGTAQTVRELPTGGPYGTGRFEVLWNQTSTPGLASLDSDSSIAITFDSVVRTTYRENLAAVPAQPVLAGDEVTNSVEVSGPDAVVAEHINDNGADTEPNGGIDGDTANDSITNGMPSIDKRIGAKVGPLANGANATGTTCSADHGTITWQSTLTTGYGPGDIVCFELGATFPALVDHGDVIIQDLLPAGYTYVPGSAVRIASIDDLPGATFDATTLRWDLGTVDNPGHDFRWVIAVELGDPDEGEAGDIFANLQKMTHDQSANISFQYRDEVPAVWTEPELTLAKGVKQVNAADNTLDVGPFTADHDGSLTGGSTSVEVQEGAVVNFRVDVSNGGNASAGNTEIWDRLPADFTCADISNISAGGSCAAGIIKWTGQTIAGAGTLQLNYDLTMPTTTTARDSWMNHAGVRSYQSGTNVGNTDYFPASNIDTTITALMSNTDAADDEAYISTAAPTVAKAQQSGINESGNSSNGTPSSVMDYATIGEVVAYDITVTIPDGTHVYSGSITDALPAGMTYFTGNASFGGSNQVLSASVTSAAVDANGDALDGGVLGVPTVGTNGTITYTLPADYHNAAGSGDDVVVVRIYAMASTGSIGNNRDNTGSFAWRDSGNVAMTTVTSTANRTRIVLPNPALTKTHTVPAGNDVVPGDTVTYRVALANTAGTNVSVLHQSTIVDTVPLGVTPVRNGGGSVTTDGHLVASAGVSPVGAFTGTWSQTNRTITWTPADWAPLAATDPGVTRTFSYQATVDNPATASGTVQNSATLTASNLAAADPNVASHRSFTTTDTDTVNLPSAAIIKDIEPLPADATDRATVPVGDTLDYDIDVTVPANTQAYDMTLFDQLPTGVTFDSFGTPVVSASCEVLPGPGALAAGDIERLTSVGADAKRIAWFIGDVRANGSACTITVPYTVHVDAAADAGDVLTNTSTLRWNATSEIASQTPPSLPVNYDSGAGSGWDLTGGTDTESITVIEPQLEIDKDVMTTGGAAIGACDITAGNNRTAANDTDTQSGLSNGCDVEAGSTLRYRLRTTNTGTSPAHDIVVQDTLPAGLTPRIAPAGALATNGATITGSTASTGTWNATNRTITWTLTGPVAATNGTVTVDYDVVLDASSAQTQGRDLSNTADVLQYFALNTSDRALILNSDLPTYGNGGGATRGSLLPDVVTVEVQLPALTLAKTATSDATDARFDQNFGWQLVTTNSAPVGRAFGVDAVDVLPAGWQYVAGSAQVTTPYGGPTQIEPSILNQTLTWTNVVSGGAQPLVPGAQITITFNARPLSSVLAPDSATGISNTGPTNPHVNSATVSGEDASGATGCCDVGSGVVGYTDTDTAQAVIRRADLSVTKTLVDTPPIHYGDIVTYIVGVTNSGPSAATGVTLTDLFSPDHTYVSTTSTDAGSFNPVTGIWNVGGIPSGTTYELEVVMEVNAAGAVSNTAEVATSGQWDPDSTPGNNVGTEDDQQTVAFTALDADIGNRLWFDIDNDGVQDPTEPGIAGVDVDVTWTDADNVVQTRTDTTDSDGNWSVAGLPIDTSATVTVDAATLPPGFTPSWELIDNPVITSAQSVNGHSPGDNTVSGIVLTATNRTYLHVDFGYTGINSVGDHVWFDVDGDGSATPQAGDLPLPSVSVSINWAGFDGVFGNADDRTFTTTTDASGDYLFGTLPDGQYSVVVDPSTLPLGLTPTYDLNGVATANTTGTFGLGLGGVPPDNKLDADFAYTGSMKLGDTVWVDVNLNGIRDAGEAPLAGIDVTATFTVSGGPVTLTTTTSINGTYEFTGVPIGVPITVTVDDSQLPAGLSAVFDIDGTSSPHVAVVTLLLGQPERTDIDFGYAGAGSIGDLVWFDANNSGGPTANAGEPGLSGVAVNLVWTNPTGGANMTLDQVTAANGAYLFTNLPPGAYVVSTTLPSGTVQTFDADGGTDHSSALVLANGAAVVTQDFSVTGTGAISDTVWRDDDGDYVQDAGETPLAGIGITVSWMSGATIIHSWSTVTDVDGHYKVDMLPAGTYRITVTSSTLPSGYVPVTELDTTLDHTTLVALAAAQNKTDVDFGYRPSADLAIAKSHTGDFRIGEENRWVLQVTNHGPAVAAAPVRIADTLPTGIQFVRSEGSEWQCNAIDQDLTCTYIGTSPAATPVDLALAAVSSVSLVVTPRSEAAPGVTNTAVVSSPTADPVLPNNTATDPTDVPLAVMALEKSVQGDLRVNSFATYELQISNEGPAVTTGVVRLVDTLPAGLTYVSSEAPSGFACSAAGAVVTCETSQPLAVGQEVTIRHTVRVSASRGSTVANTAFVTGGNVVNGTPRGDARATDVVSVRVLAADASRLSRTGEPTLMLLALGGTFIAIGVGLLLTKSLRRRLL